MEKNKKKTSVKKPTLEEKFKNYKGKNLTKDFKWDNPKGREIW